MKNSTIKTIICLILFLTLTKAQQRTNYNFNSTDFTSTFLGGSNDDDGYEPCMAIAPDGSVYVTGYTSSTNFPITSGAYDESFNGGKERFICKFDPELKTLLASSFIGGSLDEEGMGITIDNEGNIYLAGYTWSSDFPTTSNGYDQTFNGLSDAFIVKMDSDLTTLLASTYFGGVNYEGNQFPRIDIIIGNDGDIYVAGLTYSNNLPVTSNAYDKTYDADQGYQDCFVAKFDSELSTLKASTFLGGQDDEWRPNIVIDTDGNVFVSGSTRAGFPTTSNAFDKTHNGYYDAFVSKLSGDLSILLASTYLGTSLGEDLQGMRLDNNGDLYITGYAGSAEFPTSDEAYDQSFNGIGGASDAFISKFSNDLSTLIASTYIGGSSQDIGEDIILDANGNVYVVGSTHSPNFPSTANNYDESYNGGQDAFISVFDKDLKTLLGSTFLGGSSEERGQCIILNSENELYITGRTKSSGFPTTNGAFDESYNGGSVRGDCFVSKFSNSYFITGVDEKTTASLPKEFKLYNNYPNPFNPSTKIKFSLVESSYIEVKIFDMLGRLVRTLTSGEFSAGNYELEWNGKNSKGNQVNSGVYFCQLRSNRKSQIIKMNLLK